MNSSVWSLKFLTFLSPRKFRGPGGTVVTISSLISHARAAAVKCFTRLEHNPRRAISAGVTGDGRVVTGGGEGWVYCARLEGATRWPSHSTKAGFSSSRSRCFRSLLLVTCPHLLLTKTLVPDLETRIGNAKFAYNILRPKSLYESYQQLMTEAPRSL